MRKEDLKIGYIIEHRNGKFAMVMQTDDGEMQFTTKDGSYGKYEEYHDNLQMTDGYVDWYVVAVYGYSKVCGYAVEFSSENRPLLWEEPRVER